MILGKLATPFINEPSSIDIDENEACQKLLGPTVENILQILAPIR